MSGEGGYVAADALAALAILGLAVGGLTSGLFTLGRGEWATTETVGQAVSLRVAARELDRLFDAEGPFRSDAVGGFVGDAGGFDFPCGARRCAAKVASGGLVLTDAQGVSRVAKLPGVKALRLAYVGPAGTADSWPPPALPPPGPAWEDLEAVVVEDAGSGRALFVGQIAVQQAFDCQFDAIAQDCRKAAP